MDIECSSIHKPHSDAQSTYFQRNEKKHTVIRIQLKASTSSDCMETSLN